MARSRSSGCIAAAAIVHSMAACGSISTSSGATGRDVSHVAPPRPHSAAAAVDPDLEYGMSLAEEIMGSPEFRSHLAQVEALSRGLWRGHVGGADLANQLLGMDAAYEVGPATYLVDERLAANGS